MRSLPVALAAFAVLGCAGLPKLPTPQVQFDQSDCPNSECLSWLTFVQSQDFDERHQDYGSDYSMLAYKIPTSGSEITRYDLAVSSGKYSLQVCGSESGCSMSYGRFSSEDRRALANALDDPETERPSIVLSHPVLAMAKICVAHRTDCNARYFHSGAHRVWSLLHRLQD